MALGRRDEQIQERCGSAGAIIARKEPGFAANSYPLERPLGRVVVDVDVALGDVGVERIQLVEGVRDRLGHRAAR